jgi:hypothetical protein
MPKFEFNGKYQWNGLFEDPDTGAQLPFGIFADTFEQAVKECHTFPGEVISLERGPDMSGVELPEIPSSILAQIKKRMN